MCLAAALARREKAENDKLLQEQMDKYREEASTLRLDNAKMTSKVCVILYMCLSIK